MKKLTNNTSLVISILFSLLFTFGCTSDDDSDNSSGDPISMDFYVDQSFYPETQMLPEEFIEICFPYSQAVDCGTEGFSDFYVDDKSQLFRLDIIPQNMKKQLFLEKNAAENLTGVTISKEYVKDKLGDFRISESFRSHGSVTLNRDDVEVCLTNNKVNTKENVVFVFAQYGDAKSLKLLDKVYPVINSVEALRDSIASALCKKSYKKIIVLYELSLLQSSNCECPESIEKVCGDGIMYLNRCKAECAGATVITDGPCTGTKSVLDAVTFQEEAEAFISIFYDYLNEIAKGVDKIEDALNLFENNGIGVTVETNNKNSDIILTRTLEEYLQYLFETPVRREEIKIRIEDLVFDEDLKMVPNGDIHDVVTKGTYDQKYERIKIGKVNFEYSDSTKKSIEVIAKLTKNNGSEEVVWRAYLSHIRVEENAN